MCFEPNLTHSMGVQHWRKINCRSALTCEKGTDTPIVHYHVKRALTHIFSIGVLVLLSDDESVLSALLSALGKKPSGK